MSETSLKNNSVRVAIYVRVSTQWQIDKDSLPVQRDELSAYAKYVLNADSYEIFEDAGYSAKNTERPNYQKMMSRIRSGEFSYLLVWKLDRISRNLLDFAAMYEELKVLGVTFVSKNEKFDTSSAMGEAMLKIILVFAELERKMTGERVSAVMISRAGKGQWNGGKIPYGYNYDKETGTFSIEPNEEAIALKMYDIYERERSLLKVARELNQQGFRHRSGSEWTPNSVSGILKNPFLAGIYRYNYIASSKRNRRQDIKPEKEWILFENHHPAIVDKERWETICLLLNNNRRGWAASGKTYNRKNIHIFAGLITCGCCGGTMSATSNGRVLKNGYRPSIYSCMSHRKNMGCTNKYVSDRTVGPFILNYISNMIKAKASFGRTTSPETLQKKLLRGDVFADIECIEEEGLMATYNLYKIGVPEKKYLPNFEPESSEPDEQKLLRANKARSEQALTKLKNLYLYSDSSMSENDYLIEKQKIEEQLAEIDKKLKSHNDSGNNEGFIDVSTRYARISFFILSKQLTEKRFVDYERLLRQLDPKIIKDFINSVIYNFCIENGRITQITFKNGIIHRFCYKTSKSEE